MLRWFFWVPLFAPLACALPARSGHEVVLASSPHPVPSSTVPSCPAAPRHEPDLVLVPQSSRGHILHADLSRDSRVLFLVTTQGVEIWDALTWEIRAHFPTQSPKRATMAPDGDSFLFEGGEPGELVGVDLRTGKQTVVAHGDSSVRFLQDGSVLVGDRTGLTRFERGFVAHQKVDGEPVRPGYKGPGISRDGATVLTEEGAVYSLKTRTRVWRPPPGSVAAALSEDGTTVATERADRVEVFEVRSGRRKLSTASDPRWTLSPLGKWLVVGGSNHFAVYEVASGRALLVREASCAGSVFSPNERRVAFHCGVGWELELVDTRSGDVLDRTAGATPLRFSHDGEGLFVSRHGELGYRSRGVERKHASRGSESPYWLGLSPEREEFAVVTRGDDEQEPDFFVRTMRSGTDGVDRSIWFAKPDSLHWAATHGIPTLWRQRALSVGVSGAHFGETGALYLETDLGIVSLPPRIQEVKRPLAAPTYGAPRLVAVGGGLVVAAVSGTNTVEVFRGERRTASIAVATMPSALALTRDGKRLAVALPRDEKRQSGPSVMFLDVETGRELSRFDRAGEISKMTFGPEGALLALSVFNQLEFVSLVGAEPKTLGGPFAVNDWALDPSGEHAAIGQEGDLKILALRTMSLRVLAARRYPYRIGFSSQGDIVTYASDRKGVLHRLRDGVELRIETFGGRFPKAMVYTNTGLFSGDAPDALRFRAGRNVLASPMVRVGERMDRVRSTLLRDFLAGCDVGVLESTAEP